MSHFNVQQNHPLIPRKQTFVLDRKLVTIHSEDRDHAKHPLANQFEIQLPQDLENVQSMRLVDCTLPVNFSTFTNDYQNIKFQFTIFPNPRTDKYTIYDALNEHNPYIVEIDEGFYNNPTEMAKEIAGKMNDAVQNTLLKIAQQDEFDPYYSHFQCYFDYVGKVLLIGNDFDDFQLNFDVPMQYDLPVCEQPNMWGLYTKWGLPYYLGFEKNNYETSEYVNGIKYDYNNTIFCPPSMLNRYIDITNNNKPVSYIISAPFPVTMFGESAIYMEVDKYNSMDELTPYINSFDTTDVIKYNGIVNSAFAKIPIIDVPLAQIFDSRNSFLQNISQYFPPVKRISKLKIKFRFHDGRLVDFGNSNLNFTIAFNMLKDEMARDYEVRVPEEYSL